MIPNESRIISSVLALMQFENLYPSLFAQKLGEQYLDGKITVEEVIVKIKEWFSCNI